MSAIAYLIVAVAALVMAAWIYAESRTERNRNRLLLLRVLWTTALLDGLWALGHAVVEVIA